MINKIDRNKCCGCHACYNICPTNAISMIEDENGFKYPVIDKEKCVNCGKCEDVCLVLNKVKANIEPQAYACINKDEEVRLQSSSGGVFTLISNFILEKGGVVFGAVWNEDFSQVNHIYVTEKEELGKMRGAKYLQSNIDDTYKKVKAFLEEDRYVLFSGTPCQISGLKNYLGKEFEKLILQDIICHGVPSPLAWRKYKEFIEKKNKINKVEFRNKKDEGWSKYHVKIDFNNNTSYNIKHNDDVYMKAFLKNITLRNSCTNCEFKTKYRVSDITLADFWGIDNVLPEMNDEKGTSLVIVNSQKGEFLFKKISEKMEYKKVDLKEAVKYNPSYDNISIRNKNADKFFEELNDKKFNKLVNKYVPKISIFKRIKNKLKSLVKKILKK